MGRVLNVLRSLVRIRELGGGSFWRGAAYLSLGLLLVPVLLLFGWLLLPPVVRQALNLLFALVVLGGIAYAVAVVYAKVQDAVDS